VRSNIEGRRPTGGRIGIAPSRGFTAIGGSATCSGGRGKAGG